MIQLPDFLVGGSIYFEFQLVLPSDNATPVNADANPTCVVVRNGVAGSDSVTIAPLSGITGGYSLSYDPAGDTEGENIIFRILATITDAGFNGGSPASHRAFYATRCKAGASRISRVIAGDITDNVNNWDEAKDLLGVSFAEQVIEGNEPDRSLAKRIFDTQATLEAMQGTGFDAATDSLVEIRAAVDGIEIPTLTGPWTRTITVTDSVSGSPIQNATVRFFRTGETETKPTNVSGVASFTVEAATWSYAIFRSGYAGASGTVEVVASGNTAVGLVATVPATPTNPNNATLRITCIGEDSQIAPGAIVSIRMIEAPASQVGFGYDGTIATFTANSNGIAEREVARGATYEIRREGTYKQWQQFVMPTDEDLILIESFVQP